MSAPAVTGSVFDAEIQIFLGGTVCRPLKTGKVMLASLYCVAYTVYVNVFCKYVLLLVFVLIW